MIRPMNAPDRRAESEAPEGIVDFHAHAFPDALAERAVPALAREANVDALLDGKLTSLLASMDRAGIAKAVVCSIATKPTQFEKILEWSLAHSSERLVMLPSVHPADADAPAQVRRIAAAGLHGVKLHPYYQEFSIDEPRLSPLYAAAEACGLILVCHCGFDIAYPRTRIADPVRIRRVTEAFPALKFIATHLGGWEDWDEVERHLLGRPVYLDTSYSLSYLPPERARRLLVSHPADRLLFGTDTPWADQALEVHRLRSLRLPAELEQRIFRTNALALLDRRRD